MKSIEEKDQRLQVGVAFAKAVTAWNAHWTGKKLRSLPVNPKRKGLPEMAGSLGVDLGRATAEPREGAMIRLLLAGGLMLTEVATQQPMTQQLKRGIRW